MRQLKTLALLSVLAGCGGEGLRRYRVAVDPSPLSALPASCFQGGVLPPQRVVDRNLYQDFVWTVWEAGRDRVFLELESPEGGWRLGDAPAVALDGALLGDGETFAAERVVVGPGGQELESTALRVVFEQARGPVSLGVLELKSRCATCAEGRPLSCEARLAFTAREESLRE
jgi:hypothetical protein